MKKLKYLYKKDFNMGNLIENPISNIVVTPNMVIDELSSTEFYIGTSTNSKAYGASNWSIKRIWKIGSVWSIGYPNGEQTNKFVWNNRTGYSYT